MADKQIKSKQRVAEHGEVFTGEREVNAMLDLVKPETERIESRFLEPACGDGNFLTEILRRKIEVVKNRYRRNKTDCEKYLIVAVSSIYGVDIMQDNVDECRNRLFEQWNEAYTNLCGKETRDECREAAAYILKKNILCGDALTMLRNDKTPIIFAQWDLVTGNKMKRRDYRLDELMRQNEENEDGAQLSISTLDGSLEYDEKEHGWVAKPIKEYELTDYWEVQNTDDQA
jgi:hypothetical protein